MLKEPIARFAFSAASIVAINGVSRPKKLSSRLNQNKKAKNSSPRHVRRCSIGRCRLMTRNEPSGRTCRAIIINPSMIRMAV